MTAPARARQAVAQPRRRPDSRTGPAHQQFVQSLPCIACGKLPPSECAHVAGGMKLGPDPSRDDRYIVPLCGPATVWSDCCHSRLHYLGSRRFWSELGIDPLDLARNLWRVSGDPGAAASVVMAARKRIAHRAGRGEGA